MIKKTVKTFKKLHDERAVVTAFRKGDDPAEQSYLSALHLEEKKFFEITDLKTNRSNDHGNRKRAR